MGPMRYDMVVNSGPGCVNIATKTPLNADLRHLPIHNGLGGVCNLIYMTSRRVIQKGLVPRAAGCIQKRCHLTSPNFRFGTTHLFSISSVLVRKSSTVHTKHPKGGDTSHAFYRCLKWHDDSKACSRQLGHAGAGRDLGPPVMASPSR